MSFDADVAVIGLGAMGSMALWRLATRGVRVIGFEQFTPGHDRGSSHGESRIIRTAYYEAPAYVPLLHTAFGLWRDLERESGDDLLTMTGALMIGRPDGPLLRGVQESVREHHIAHEMLSHADMAHRYPQHRLDAGSVAIHEGAAGFLRPERAMRAAVARARALGAEALEGVRITELQADRSGVHITAGDRTWKVGHAVVTVGPWLPTFMPRLPVTLQVERQVLAWFRPRNAADFSPDRFPVFMHEQPNGGLRYGFPTLDGAAIKIGVHHGGAATTADTVNRATSDEDDAPLRDFLAAYLPGVEPTPVRREVCMYTNTPDEHFAIGSPPSQERLTVLSCCSGHGFKFAAVMGDIAADLAATGRTVYPIAPFALDRFSPV